MTSLHSLEAQIGDLLISRKKTLAVAESCTGGLIMHLLTNVPGISARFPGGIVAYAYEAKAHLLGVRAETLAVYGAVSEQTAFEMAHGVRSAFGTDFGLSVTGIAGPGGGTPSKPVGLVYIALCSAESEQVIERRWASDREGNKALSADAALQLLIDRLNVI